MKDSEKILSLVQLWRAANNQGNAKEVAKVYSEAAILLPPADDPPIHGKEGIQAWFENFYSRKPKLLKLEYDEPILRSTEGADIAYMLQLCRQEDGSGHYSIIDIFERIDGKWFVTLSAWDIPKPA